MLKIRESTHTESSGQEKALDSILGAQGSSQKALGRSPWLLHAGLATQKLEGEGSAVA